jgi:hypothetical protein
MPTWLELIENGHATRLTITEPWTVADLTARFAEGRALRDQSTHKIHSLVDLRGIRTLPDGLLRARLSPIFTHPNSGHAAFIEGIALTRTFVDMMMKLTHFDRAEFFKTEAEALAYLRDVIQGEAQTTRPESS